MNLIKKFVTGLGNQTAPFGFSPDDPEAGYKAGLGYIGDIGANLLANNQGGVDPFANLGASIQQAKASGTQRNKEQYTAQRLMEEAALKRQEREKSEKLNSEWQKWVGANSDKFGEYASIAPYLDPDQGMQILAGMKPDWRPATPEEKTSLGVGNDTPLVITADGPKVLGGGNSTTNNYVNVGGEIPDSKLREELDKSEGKTWDEYKKAGTISGQNAQDFAVLDELLKVAPQGPITGRLAAAVPGVSSAGDAVQSIIKRIAPTLRAPGSGSTSDIEYQGMLQSLPALANQPKANAMIISIMKAKADLNVQRSEIVTRYQAGEIDVSTARKEIAKLDRLSIMTPEMKKALLGISGAESERSDLQIPPPDGWDEEDWKYLTPEEKQRALGQ
jgi:hypothetical protein